MDVSLSEHAGIICGLHGRRSGMGTGVGIVGFM